MSLKEDKKPHLAFFVNSLRYGGAERVVTNLSRYFAESGRYKVSVMLIEDSIDYAVSDRVEMTRLHPKELNAFGKIFSLIMDPFRLKRFIKTNGVDIILSFCERPNAINMLSKALGSRHRSVVNVRCCMKVHYRNTFNVITRMIGYLIFKWLWKYADKTVVNSRVIKEEVTSLFGIDPKKVEVIYNPLDLKDIERRSKERVEEEWFHQDVPIIINVGSFTRPKGHFYLLKAFADLSMRKEARLILIGDGELEKAITKEAEKLGIRDKILFLGWQDNPYKYLARSRLFVLSSLWEGFPNVVLEALACGCPIVAFDCPSGPSEILLPQHTKGEIIKGRYGILVKKIDEKPLSKAIEDMLTDKDLMELYVKEGRKRAGEFDISIIGEAFKKTIL